MSTIKQVLKDNTTGLYLKSNTAGDFYKEDKNRWVSDISQARRFPLKKDYHFSAGQIAEFMTEQYGKPISAVTVRISEVVEIQSDR